MSSVRIRLPAPITMKLVLAKDTTLETTIDFTIYEKHGNFTVVNNKIYNVKNIGVYLSGGLDSTALLCLIAAEMKTNDIDLPITCYTVDKKHGYSHCAKNVIDYVEKKFDLSIEHIENIPNNSQANELGNIGPSAIRYIKKYKPHSLIYMGINRMPPDNIKTFNNKLLIDYGDNEYNDFYVAPFLFLHKPQIIDILYQLKCEDIIPYTHSCVMNKDQPCGKCYSCEERSWGFEVLDRLDPAISIDI